MKRAEDIVSPKSWLIIFVGFAPLFVILFNPSPLEFLVFFIVDQLSLFCFSRADKAIFTRLHPASRICFENGPVPEIANYTPEEKLQVYEAMRSFPEARAGYVLWMSYLKVIPAALVIVFFWQHEVSNQLQLFRFLLAGSVIYFYLYGAAYIENHLLVSQKIALLHDTYDFSEAFKRAPIPFRAREFETPEIIAVLCQWLFTLGLQAFLLTTTHSHGPFSITFQLMAVGVGGLALVSRVWYLGRKHVVGGMESLLQRLEELDLDAPQAKSLPLHSSSGLSKFGKTVNAMHERIQIYKNELIRWTDLKTEESRYRALGELSALIVHDLSAPLQVIHFCIDEIRRNQKLVNMQQYIDQLEVNSERSLQLIRSLRSYLRNSHVAESGARFWEVHQHVIRLLSTEFGDEELESVVVAADESLHALSLRISEADFIHVLLNLLRNSYEDFVRHGKHDGRIVISAVRETSSTVTLRIEDNGSGLTLEEFESLTSLTHFNRTMHTSDAKHGLGLRLVRRLVERYDGELSLQANSALAGTAFHLTLQTSVDQPRGLVQ